MSFQITAQMQGDEKPTVLKVLTTKRKGRAERQYRDFCRDNLPHLPVGTCLGFEEVKE